MQTTCEHEQHTPRYDDGIEEIRDVFVQVRHPAAGWTTNGIDCWLEEEPVCIGWVYAGAQTRKHGDDEPRIVLPMVSPCPICQPGKAAVYAAGYHRTTRDWTKNADARAVFRQAEGRWPTAWVEDAMGRLRKYVNKPIPGIDVNRDDEIDDSEEGTSHEQQRERTQRLYE